MDKKGLYANIHAKRKRIKAGSKERMRKPGSEGAPNEKVFKDAAKTVKEERMSQRMTIEDIAEKHGTSIKAIEVQITKGIEIEKEHTASEKEARKIAMDHLVGIPDYYTRLVKMEKEAKNEGVRITKSLEQLQEKKKKKTKSGARDYNAKAMWGKVKAQIFKAKKGKGSFSRKGKHKGMNEGALLEGAANFKNLGGDLPLLVWMDYDSTYDSWRYEARQNIEDEFSDTIEEMGEDEIESLVDQRIEDISDNFSSYDTALLNEDDFSNLESDKDEFNIMFRNKYDNWEGDVVSIEYGYHEGAQLYVDTYGMKPEELAEVEEFLYTMKEKYYLTELGSGGEHGYSTKGRGQGLNQIDLPDDDLKEDLLPPSEEVVKKFSDLLTSNGYEIESIKRYETYGDEEQVHFQIKSKEAKFSESDSSFIIEAERLSDLVADFDRGRDFHITYSIGLTNDGYVTAGLDLRSQWLDPETMISLEEVKTLLKEENKAVRKKAKASGMPYSTLMKVYRRGVAAWNSGHRPGTTPQQWGLARVNSYVTKGKGTYYGADKDLREDEHMEENKKYFKGLSPSTIEKRKAHWAKAGKLSDRDPRAYEPAPGDARAETKPSKHTKKYQQMFGEETKSEVDLETFDLEKLKKKSMEGSEEFEAKFKEKASKLGATIQFLVNVSPQREDPAWYDENFDIGIISFKGYNIGIYVGGDMGLEYGEETIRDASELEDAGIFTDDHLHELIDSESIYVNSNKWLGFHVIKDGEDIGSDYDLGYEVPAYSISDAFGEIGFYINEVIFGIEEELKKEKPLEEASKDIGSLGKPTRDDLKKAAKRHKKTDKKGARGYFVKLNRNLGPLVQQNIARFNDRTPGDSAPMPTIGSQYTAPADAGSSGPGISASASAGLGEAILTEKVERHEVLNPKLWEGNELKSEVKEKILQIVDTFVRGLSDDGIKMNVKDIVLIGSNASYNYSDISDLDVHIMVDTKELECPDNLYPLLYSSYRSIFNKKYDIEFYGTGVEVFVDTEGTKTISNGIYSLNSGWIKEPVKEDIPEFDKERFIKEFIRWEDEYFEIIKGEDVTTDEKQIQDIKESIESNKIDKIDNFIEDVYDLRKMSLQKDGEYSIGNLVFKEMRALGYLDNLKALKNQLKSKELSLEELETKSLKEEVNGNMIMSKKEANRYAKMVKENGTYFINEDGLPEQQELVAGFQVSFFRPEITDSEIEKIIGIIGNSFGQQYLGIYQGSGEISYTLESSMAKEVARIFNQESIWDNEKGNAGYTPNQAYNESTIVDYAKAAGELKVLLGK